jgi:hypothetical protein
MEPSTFISRATLAALTLACPVSVRTPIKNDQDDHKTFKGGITERLGGLWVSENL